MDMGQGTGVSSAWSVRVACGSLETREDGGPASQRRALSYSPCFFFNLW